MDFYLTKMFILYIKEFYTCPITTENFNVEELVVIDEDELS